MQLPPLFTYLEAVDPTILQDIRYAESHNFIGRPLQGYLKPRCIITIAAAQALQAVQHNVVQKNLSLKVYDAYRPTKTVAQFMKWCESEGDETMRAEFYPRLSKRELVLHGYLSPQSEHCTGSAVDLTLVPLPVPHQPVWRHGDALVDGTAPYSQRFADNSIDMGTAFDVFDPMSHTASTLIGPTARANRDYLEAVMSKHGFRNYDKEWWHYCLRDRPTLDTFDFDIA